MITFIAFFHRNGHVKKLLLVIALITVLPVAAEPLTLLDMGQVKVLVAAQDGGINLTMLLPRGLNATLRVEGASYRLHEDITTNRSFMLPKENATVFVVAWIEMKGRRSKIMGEGRIQVTEEALGGIPISINVTAPPRKSSLLPLALSFAILGIMITYLIVDRYRRPRRVYRRAKARSLRELRR